MRADELEPIYRNDEDDMIMQRHAHDSRKPTITLLSLNKLKKMRAAKDLENLMRGDFMEIIYGSTGEEAPGGV
jgi:hypothetical protein